MRVALTVSIVLTALVINPAGATPSVLESPQAVIEASAQVVLRSWKGDAADGRNATRLQSDVARVMDAHVDWSMVGRLVLGKHWRSAEAGDRKRFVAEFRNLLIRTYAATLNSADRPSFEVLDSRSADDGRTARVRAKLSTGGNGAPVELIYRLRRKEHSWRIIDVSIAGFSLVTNYRNHFRNELSRRDLPDLIDRLAALNLARNGYPAHDS